MIQNVDFSWVYVALAIFSSRWLQSPLYFGLIIAQTIYAYKFVEEVFHLIMQAEIKSENEIMLMVLTLVDIVMVSNLLIMIIIGGYETFVSRLGLDSHPDKPEWLDHVNANTKKIKLAMALIGISSTLILKIFIGIEKHLGIEKHQNDVTMWTTSS